MKQTNVENRHRSEELLRRFEEISPRENVKDISALSTSIVIKCKCGCCHIEHFNVPMAAQHYQRHYVELCERHAIAFEN